MPRRNELICGCQAKEGTEEKQDEMEKVNNLIVQSEESCGVGGGWRERAQRQIPEPQAPTWLLTPRDNSSKGLRRGTAPPELRYPKVPSISFKERSRVRNWGGSECAELKAKQGKGGEDGKVSFLSFLSPFLKKSCWLK
ncbi:unnamed protein product [Rangifer tarandus platyrhynchus]|uniref:Uncharacterized protein n=1 Tax=Rangifer tarandus platyrhynchus TaxID=3082113 RepID=A0ABN8Y8E8_RANTA|nr:unnamed protein product [Rangifer tarandus platyrhynchus]